MPASNTDKFKKAKRRFTTTIGTGGISGAGTTLPLLSVTGLDTDTAITLVLDPGLLTEEVITGVVSGSDIINCVRGKEGTTAQAHSVGAVVAMYFTETHWDDAMDGILAQHNQDGTHASNAITPTASVIPYAGSTAPANWLLCDGSAISRTTYATLFAIISTTYGVGNGTTTFNIPDLRGRVAVAKSTDTEFDTLGETGGAKTHTLSTAEMPAHTHTRIKGNDNNLGGNHGWQSVDDGSGAHASDSTGGGGAHNNLQPYITLNYIIRT